jgi:hypothetical protein
MSVEDKVLPGFDYYLDESDPDVVVVLREDGAFAADRIQRPRGHQGGHRGGRQGGLQEGHRGQRGALGPPRSSRPTEERLEKSGGRRSLA